jgi:hypothetical protein
LVLEPCTPKGNAVAGLHVLLLEAVGTLAPAREEATA